MTSSRILHAATLAVMLAGLTGCGDGGVHEVKQWMDETRRSAKVMITPIAPPKQFTPSAYDGKNDVDPFSPVKLSIALAKAQANSNSGIKPDFDRRREALEAYPLDTITMVGTLEKPGLSYALLQADKTVFKVKVGNYIGQNFGMVTKITATEVELKEIVRDASGEWVERDAKLELQENKK
ncbi:pilus assembly protein PilP [Noviherbaspirillum massiliense]|uniref:pilus assembly protein PilP n=1 Tax=Noviherbaspirillum massiliense TaxID=1465823 RepID=UPI0003181AD1|nr:pilus assembly protein PilP [Noviherbaspirillum massiliense]